MYNTTNITNSNNIVEMFLAVNTLSNSLFVSMILLVLFFVILIMFSNYDKKVVFLVDSLLITILSIFFFTIGAIGWTILIAPIILLFGSLIYNTMFAN